MGRGILTVSLIFVTGCTAHFPVNPPLQRYEPNHGYRLQNLGVPGNSGELLVVLTFSGGGTRSAALAYGVLEQLAATTITTGGRQRRLLDEVDVISAVSGGSFTAAYYGLYGDRIFQDFEERFLTRNIDKGLTGQLFSPANWARLVSARFSRSDLAALYYDKHIFDGKTFADIAARKGPAIIINATDMSL
ncbi:MAG: patatin-like phospholipase family protein, partial [Burkholderiales bacterium]|nr:patatin-like phospholipase family protein [Burkholderiales bacterium]